MEDLDDENMTVEPRRKFRWSLELPGVPWTMVRTVRSLPGRVIEVGVAWHLYEQWPPRPTSRSGTAALRFISPTGDVTDVFEIAYGDWELLPFDLDYADGGPVTPKIVLGDVVVRRVGP